MSNSLNVLKDLSIYFTVKYVNILNYENSVNITVIAKKGLFSNSQNNKTNLTNSREHDTTSQHMGINLQCIIFMPEFLSYQIMYFLSVIILQAIFRPFLQ